MDISLHLLLVVALLTPMIVVVLAEATLRRRLRSFRVFQLFVLASGLLLIPANIVSVQAPVPSTFHVSVMAGSFAALAAQALLSALLRLPVERAQQRPGEAYRGASFMRLTDCTVLGLPDTRLSRQENEMVAAIEGKMRALNPDVIFTHSGNDQHQDHSAVHWATMRAGRRHQAILCYEAAVALAACRALGLRGPADVDVRRRADGTPVVLEINARFGANSAHAPAMLDAALASARTPLGAGA